MLILFICAICLPALALGAIAPPFLYAKKPQRACAAALLNGLGFIVFTFTPALIALINVAIISSYNPARPTPPEVMQEIRLFWLGITLGLALIFIAVEFGIFRLIRKRRANQPPSEQA